MFLLSLSPLLFPVVDGSMAVHRMKRHGVRAARAEECERDWELTDSEAGDRKTFEKRVSITTSHSSITTRSRTLSPRATSSFTRRILENIAEIVSRKEKLCAEDKSIEINDNNLRRICIGRYGKIALVQYTEPQSQLNLSAPLILQAPVRPP